MKTTRCYGKKKYVLKQEKSFVRNFFEGNESSESSLICKSSKDILEKDSLEENKENVVENIQFPPLFDHVSVKSISPNKESFSERQKTNTVPAKRNKKVKKKGIIRRKPKQVFPKSTKFYAKIQPNWGEICKHDLTIEKEGAKSSRYRSYGKRTRNTRKHTSVTAVSNKGKRNPPKQRIFSISDSSDSSGDWFTVKVSKEKPSQSDNACNLKQQLNNVSYTNISELNKQFEQSIKLGNFSVTPDDTSFINEDVYTEPNELNRPGRENTPDHMLSIKKDIYTESPLLPNKSLFLFEEPHELNSPGSENLDASNYCSAVLKTKVDDISARVKSISFKNTSKNLNPASFIHTSHVLEGKVNTLERISNLKILTSTPIIPKTKFVYHPVNVDSLRDNSSRSGASTSKVSHAKPHSDMIFIEKSLNFHDKKIEGYSDFYPNNVTSSKQKIPIAKSLLSDLVSCNKSLTLPQKKSTQSLSSIKNESSLESLFLPLKKSTKSLSSIKNQSLFESSHEVPQEKSDESAKTKLLKLCTNDSVLNFANVYDWEKCKIKKIGEGSYGEVFMLTKSGKSSCVLKIIPISEEPSGDYQGLSNVLSEVKITKCLSELRNNKRNNAKNFIKMNNAFVVAGVYPSVFLEAWDNYSETKSSYNDRPDIYKENQMFVLLELEYGGKDMSSCMLRNALEAESVLKQIATSLAVAEEEYIFEHRDLHLGNILIKRNRKKYITYKLRGKEISFECHGVEATLIDFTLSRLYEEGYIYYNDLAQDVSLFEQSGDYQFEVYKNMKGVLRNDWKECCFYSNILWLKFLCQKFKEFEYSRPSSVAHKKGLKAIDTFNDLLTNCNSAVECLTICGITPIYFEKSNTDSELTKKSILISRNSVQKSKLSICH